MTLTTSWAITRTSPATSSSSARLQRITSRKVWLERSCSGLTRAQPPPQQESAAEMAARPRTADSPPAERRHRINHDHQIAPGGESGRNDIWAAFIESPALSVEPRTD